MKSLKDLLLEGGWANPITQNTKITPATVADAVNIIKDFTVHLNAYLKTKDIPPCKFSHSAGSATYYERDLKVNPTKEYGDIDVVFLIPRIEGTSNNANVQLITSAVKEFCEQSKEYQTANGTNVIFKIGNDYVQVDLIMSYYHNQEWSKVLAPEWNIKGVLCNSLYSSLGEALHLSIGGGHGVQAKKQDGQLVPFNQQKNVELIDVTNHPHTWAIDVVKFLGCKEISPQLEAFPGMLREIKVSDLISSIKGIAQTLELNGKSNAKELMQQIKTIYLSKINKAINSSKYDKASTPDAIKKAEYTKKMLAQKSKEFAELFDI